MSRLEEMKGIIRLAPDFSAWRRGVKTYAMELVDALEEGVKGGYADITSLSGLRRALLNGARDWQQYSEGGCSLIYNEDIAKRLCTKSEYEQTRGGERDPSPREDWIQCQARALRQAAALVETAWRQTA